MEHDKQDFSVLFWRFSPKLPRCPLIFHGFYLHWMGCLVVPVELLPGPGKNLVVEPYPSEKNKY